LDSKIWKLLSDYMLIWYESRDLFRIVGKTYWCDRARYVPSRLDCYIPGDTRPSKLESRGRNVHSILQGLRDMSSESLSPFALCLSVVHTRARAYAWHVHAWLPAFRILPPYRLAFISDSLLGCRDCVSTLTVRSRTSIAYIRKK